MTLSQESVQDDRVQVNTVDYDEKMDEVMSLMSQGSKIDSNQGGFPPKVDTI
jgi:hypothetical protein